MPTITTTKTLTMVAALFLVGLIHEVTCGGVVIQDMPRSRLKVVEQGSDVTFICTHANSMVMLLWSSNQTDIPSNTPASRMFTTNGTLTISNTTVGDSGVFSCREMDAPSNRSVSISLRVYIMPDYKGEWLVVGVAAGGGCGVLLVGMVVMLARERRHLRTRENTNRNMRKSVARSRPV